MSDQKSGSPALKIILIVFAVIVVLGIGAVALVVGGVRYFAHHLTEKRTTITSVVTDNGTVTNTNSTTFTAAELGTDIYPGATPVQGGSHLDSPSGTVTTAVFSTDDSVAKVTAFYKGKFGSGATVFSTDDGGILSRTISANEAVTVTISLDKSDNKTKFVIMHSLKKGS